MTVEEAEKKAKSTIHLPCSIKCIDKAISNSLKNASDNLKIDGFKHQFNEEIQLEPEQPIKYSSLAKAVAAVKRLMMKLDHRLCRGFIYCKIPEGEFLF